MTGLNNRWVTKSSLILTYFFLIASIFYSAGTFFIGKKTLYLILAITSLIVGFIYYLILKSEERKKIEKEFRMFKIANTIHSPVD